MKEAISSVDPRQAFAHIQNDGLVKYNSSNETFKVIKKSEEKTKVVYCKTCNGAYNATYFHRHKKTCKQTNKPIPAKVLSVSTKDKDFASILGSFQDNAIGKLCRADKTLQYIGEHLFMKDKGKVDKRMEVKRSVMTDMRTLARIYSQFQIISDSSAEDMSEMFKRNNFDTVTQAIQSITLEGNELKYGLKTCYILSPNEVCKDTGRTSTNHSRWR